MFENQNPDDGLKFQISKVGEDFRLSRNFRLKEARSGCGSDIVFVHPALILLMQSLRDQYGPLRVNSMYRSQEWNLRIQGEKGSKHTLGMAVDLSPLETKFERFKNDIMKRTDIGGVGIYSTFIHLDVYGNGRRWHG